MKVPKITRTMVVRWMPEDAAKDSWLRCGTVRGLCLRVRPRAGGGWRREWFVRYTWFGRNRFRALGEIDEWGLDQAADEVRDCRRRVKQALLRGEPDPLRHAKPVQETLATMAQLADVYNEHSTKDEDSRKEDSRRWATVLERELPDGVKMADKAVVRVSPADLWAIRKVMEGTPVEFNRLRALLSNALNLAQGFGLVTAEQAAGWENPTRKVKKFPEKKRNKVFSEDEYRAIRLALDRLIEEYRVLTHRQGRFRARTLLALRIMSRIGCRPKELRMLTLGEVFWSERFADTTKAKGDRGGAQGRIMAFGEKGFADLRLMKELAEPGEPGSQFLMPGWTSIKGPMNKTGYRSAWALVKETADALADTHLVKDESAQIYALRHTLVNRHSRAGVDLGDMHDFIGHRSALSGIITHTYRHTDIPRFLELATTMEDHMDSICYGEASTT